MVNRIFEQVPAKSNGRKAKILYFLLGIGLGICLLFLIEAALFHNFRQKEKMVWKALDEEKIVLDRTMNIAQQVLNNFNNKSVIGNAVQFASDQAQQMSAREVTRNFYKFLQLQVDAESRLASEKQAVMNVLQNAQAILQ